MKRIALIIGLVVVAGGLVGIGYWLASGSTTTPQPAAAPAPQTGAGGDELRGLLDHGKSQIYHARYQASSSDPNAAGQDLTLEMWQKGTDRRQDLLITADGKKAHSAGFLLPSGAVACTTQADSPWNCRNVPGGTPNQPMLDQLAAQFAGQAGAGRDDQIAGHKVRCFTVSVGATPGEICLTPDGVPARVLAGPSRFELVDLSTDIPTDTFHLPAQPT
jgi:hypothetical protein